MKINILVEGGIGDLMLATRFIAATREKYPVAYITVFVNNDHNEKFNEYILKHWGHLFDAYEPEVTRLNKNHTIQSQFGSEHYPAAFNNIAPEWRKKMLDCDRFYNFHLDALTYFDYPDIPWFKYVRHIPTPRDIPKLQGLPGKFVALNLYARPGHFSAITKEASDKIIENLRDSIGVVILAPSEEVRDTFYEKHKDLVRVTDLSESLGIAARSELGLSLDSGLRYMFYANSKICFTFCGLIQQPGQVSASHIARWYPWPEHMLPLTANPAFVSSLVENAVENPACQMFPLIPAKDINQAIIKRQYA